MLKTNLFLILLLISFSACDILTTREPEKPIQPGTSLQQATVPSILFSNLVESFNKKVTENYLNCLADSSLIDGEFKFYPAGSSLNKFNVLQNWTRDSERRYFNNLKNNVSANKSITLSLQNEVSNIQGDMAVYQFDYTISFENSSIGQEIYKGIAEFKIKVDKNNVWVITEWTDRSIQGYSCWSDLKGRYYL